MTKLVQRWGACLALLGLACLPGMSLGQETPGVVNANVSAEVGVAPAADAGVVQTGCHGCSSGGLFTGGCTSCGSGSGCVPGRLKHCDCCDHPSFAGRMFCGLYECLCCPDPCYEGEWVAAANASFFADSVRPRTHMRLRWDAGRHFEFPDRAEYFWARADGNGKGPSVAGAGERDMAYDQFSLYMEAGAGIFAAFVETPYRETDPELFSGESGFVDMNVGTKSLLLDCELMQLTFQFKTFIPTAAPGKGLGTGHVSLEPSLLSSLKLAPDLYLQSQAAYLIPISGDAEYDGDIFHYHLSLNKVLWRPLADVQVIGTAELNGFSILDGAFTDANGVTQDARDHIVTIGPGLRVDICNRVDFGVGAAFAVTDDHFTRQLYRAELRILY